MTQLFGAARSTASALFVFSSLAFTSCKKKEEPPPQPPPVPAAPLPTVSSPPIRIDPARLAPFAPLPAAPDWKSSEMAKAQVELGRLLFHDKRLSTAHDLSCSKCHLPSTFGTDGRDSSPGHGGTPTARNTPSIYGAALLPSQFWDGRAATVEAAIASHLADSSLMGAPGEARIERTLRSMPVYVEAFQRAFPGSHAPVSASNAVNALGAFVRVLVAPARWDRFLQGEESAITDGQKVGVVAFVDLGCVECHSGALVGGDKMKRLGKAKPWPNASDKGRGSVTQSLQDEMTFRVPSLRNVSRTAPYFHDASAKTLGEAVRLMAAHQLGTDLEEETVRSIVGWLDSLSADAAALESTPPELPPSTLQTPKPSRL